MRLEAIKNKVTSKVGRQILITQKHSPTLLFGVGVVGVVATVVLASQATLKMSTILEEAEENQKKIEKAKDLDSTDYTESDHAKDTALNKTKTAIKIVKLYTPAVVIGTLSIGAFTGSHVVLSRRNAGLTAAYVAVDQGFKEYRSRVVKEYGTDKDREFRYGVTEKEFAVDTDEGVAVKTIKVLNPGSKHSIYARLFSKETTQNWNPTASYNQMFVRSQRNYANDLLTARGHVFLNEVHDMLGLERTSAGQIVGWVKGHGDSFIDFGIFDDVVAGQRFASGDESSVWLDFNVDGPVYDLI